MKNSCPVILSSVLLLFFVSISGGVQGQDFGTCNTTEFIDGETMPYYNSQTIYSILCLNRQDPAVDPTDYKNPNFSTLCSLLDNSTQVKNILNDASAQITFFAPANTAFVDVNTTGGNPDTIRAILQTHILPNPKLLKDLPCDECQCTIEGGGPCRTRTRTVCPTAGSTYQVGGGNTGPGGVQEFPEIGQPLGTTGAFRNTKTSSVPEWGPGNNNIIRTNEEGRFSEDAVACNGIIHAVNKIILPGVGGRNPQCGTTPGGKGGKGSKSESYYGGYGGYGGKSTKGYGGYGGYGGKGQKGRQLDMEDTFFDDEEEDEDKDEDEDEVEGEEEDSSVVPPQDGAHSSTSAERSQRRKRFLETLINPNGEIEPLE